MLSCQSEDVLGNSFVLLVCSWPVDGQESTVDPWDALIWNIFWEFNVGNDGGSWVLNGMFVINSSRILVKSFVLLNLLVLL